MAKEPLIQKKTIDFLDTRNSTSQNHTHFEEACRRHQDGDNSSAVRLYQQAIQTDSNNHAAWRNLGALLRQQGKIQEARQCTEQALKLDSSDGSLWGNYGNVLRDQGLLEESCRAFREGLKRAPNSKGLLQGLALSLGQRGDHRQVVDLITPVADEALLNGGHRDNALAELLLELGNAHHALGEKHRALQRWREGTHGAEGDKRLFIGLNIAQVLCGDKQFNEAAQLCQDLEPLFPDNENLVYAQGVIARGKGDLERAAQLFEQALERNPAYPICLNTYGLLLRDIGRTHQSRHCFEQALKHDPNFGAAMNNWAQCSRMWSLRRGFGIAQQKLQQPAAHSNVLFTLVGYELEPADKRLVEAQRFAKRFGQQL